MTVSMYESQLRQKNRQIDAAKRKKSDAEAKAAKLGSSANDLRRKANSTSSESMRKSYLSQAEKKDKEQTKAAEAAAKASQEVTRLEGSASQIREKLDRAKTSEDRKEAERDRQAKKREDRKREQADREQARREAGQEQRIFELQTRTSELEARLQQEAPKKIKVVFIAAVPEDQTFIRPDVELREIQQRVRASEFRDSIEFEIRTATRISDLMQILNETKPDVVHFSGHGDRDGLAFEDADGNTKELPSNLIASWLRASSERIHLAVFNSC